MPVETWTSDELIEAQRILSDLVPDFYKSADERPDDEEWVRVDRALRRPEQRFQRDVYRAHLIAIEVLRQQLKEGCALAGMLHDAQYVMLPFLFRAGVEHFPDMVAQGWETANRQIREASTEERSYPGSASKQSFGVMFDLDWPEVAQHIANRPHLYSPAVARTSIERFRGALQEGFNAGLGIDDITRNILRQQLPGISRLRATTIARTEVISASNLGALSSYQASRVVEQKKWLYTHDAKTRDTHRTSQVVPVTRPFVLSSGAQLMHPGDTSRGAPLSEIVNCRCAMRPVVKPVAATARPRVVEPAKPTYRPARAPSEAAQFASQDFPHIRFDFVGTHIDTINPTMQAFYDMANRYPQVADRLRYVGTYVTAQPSGLASDFRWGKDTWAHASRDGTRLGLNPRWYGNPREFLDSLKASGPMVSRWHPSADIRHVIVHEYGHQVLHYFDSLPAGLNPLNVSTAAGYGDKSEVMRVFRQKWFRRPYTPEVSTYAMTNWDEAWAEAFTQTWAAETGEIAATSRLSKAQAQLINVYTAPDLPTSVTAPGWRSLTEEERARVREEGRRLYRRLGLEPPDFFKAPRQ